MKETEVKKRGVTIGTFDGVHRGHLAVVETLRTASAERGLQPLVMTFDRHPLETIAPQRAPKLLMDSEEKLRRISGLGMESHNLIFTGGLASVTARDWLRRLRDEFDASLIVIGYDNTFGCDGRSLGTEDYKRIAEEEGLELIVAPEVAGISSSAIRETVSKGDVRTARKMMGYPFTLTGQVVPGKALGRKLGFPTANLRIEEGMIYPAHGVYVAEVALGDGVKHRAVVNVGVRPTVDEAGEPSVEVHIPGYSGDLYNKKIKVEFLDRLRSERRFSDVESLKEAIAMDVKDSLEWKEEK